MGFITEFNERNYPNVFIDYKPRERLGSHYCVDTSILLAAIGHFRDKNLSESLLYKWCAKHLITLHQVILVELYGKLYGELKFDRSIIKVEYKELRKRLRNLLNRPNFRFVLKDPLDTRNWRKVLTDANYTKFLSKSLSELGSIGDAELLALSLYENGEIVTCDKRLDEVSFRYRARSHNILIEKLPKDFVGDWTLLKKELILKA